MAPESSSAAAEASPASSNATSQSKEKLKRRRVKREGPPQLQFLTATDPSQFKDEDAKRSVRSQAMMHWRHEEDKKRKKGSRKHGEEPAPASLERTSSIPTPAKQHDSAHSQSGSSERDSAQAQRKVLRAASSSLISDSGTSSFSDTGSSTWQLTTSDTASYFPRWQNKIRAVAEKYVIEYEASERHEERQLRSLVVGLARSYNVGRTQDPFDVLPQFRNPRLDALYLSRNCMRAFASDATMKKWLPLMLSHPHIILSSTVLASTWLDMQNKVSGDSTTTAMVKTETIGMIKERFADSKSQLDDATLIVILHLFAGEMWVCNEQALRVHERGVAALISRRGGVHDIDAVDIEGLSPPDEAYEATVCAIRTRLAHLPSAHTPDISVSRDWVYEACRIAATIYTTAIAMGVPFSVAADPSYTDLLESSTPFDDWNSNAHFIKPHLAETLYETLKRTDTNSLWKNMSGVLYWTFCAQSTERRLEQDTEMLSLGFGIHVLVVMALVSRLFVHRHTKTAKQDIYTVDGDNGDSYQLPHRSSSWKQLFTPKQKDANSKWVTTLSGIIKAGDEGLWSSSLFTNPHGHPGEVSFEAICEMFANELRPLSMTERSAYSGDIGKFINSAKRGAPGPRRVQSVSYKRVNTGRGDVAPPTQRKSTDISSIERGLRRSLSIKRPAPALVPMGNGLVAQDKTVAAQHAWMKDGRPAEYCDGRMSVRLTSAELATLSLILGSSVTSIAGDAGGTTASTDKGALGLSIRITTADGKHLVSLRQHKRSISQMPSSGSGYSPLFVKHLACGSLPFSRDGKSINSFLITDDTLDAVQSGVLLTMRKRSQQSSQAHFLATLPSSCDLAFHSLEASTKSSPPTPLIDAIAQLPFTGGLTPLASTPIVSTIQFIASGGRHPGRLLQRLEALVDKVQRHSPDLNIFGPLHEPKNAGLLFRERERLAKVSSGTVTETLLDKVARVQRYVTLLQRLMALVPDIKPQDVLAAVQEATKKEVQRAYADAIAAHSSPGEQSATLHDTHCPAPDARSRRHASTSSRPSVRRSPRSSLGSASNGTVRSDEGKRSNTFPEHNLGKQVEGLLKAELPFSIEMVAGVARLVVVAWTLSVGGVAWGKEEGWRVPDLEAMPMGTILV
ncbi:hypothetical protein E8E11_011035 [Didymella keratinophila]|nr:hypothetical protein E8E11_011035 [Didymella keratinophila]